MKTASSRRQDGFTLIELLVVITIIAVLAGAGFAAASAAIQKARKVTALANVVSLESAVNAFYTDYSGMPTAATEDTKIETNSQEGKDLLKVLLGIETGNAPLNPKAVKYLSVKEGKAKGTTGGSGGLVYSGTSGTDVQGLYDPWGGSYKLMLDCDFDEKVKVKPKGTGAVEVTLNRRVAAWSDGADGVDANVGKAADDVKNW